MTEYDNNLRGVLFKNDKEGVETRADYRGHCEINRVEFWMDAWIKTAKKDGKKFMSVSFKQKQAAEVKGGEKNPPAHTEAKPKPDFDDDIPF
jgi:hypothetical protein